MSATLAAPPTTIGKFVWRDLVTTDPERAKAFYTALFGWDVKPMGMTNDSGTAENYDMLANAGTDFGGIVTLDKDHSHVPPHWSSYITVESVDETVATATRLGGMVYLPPTDIPDVGRFAVVADPQGAVFQPFTMTMDAGPEPQGPPPMGSPCWNELITADPDGAKAFYGEIFGWQFETGDMGTGPYTIIKRGDQMEGGMFQKPPEVPATMWLIYYYVGDLDHTLADVGRLGGQVFGEIITVPTIGRISWAADPTGAIFALLEPEAPQ